MGRRMRRRGGKNRGIVGIEAAIVLIAFVVIAAALAYVVINMGFYASQTAKSTIDKGLQEATSALELDGFVTGWTDSNGNVTSLAIPLKLAVGQADVDLAVNTVVVAVQGANFSLANIYSGAITSNETDLANLMTNVTNPPNATCFIYNAQYVTDTTLKQNAKAYLVINLGSAYALTPYSQTTVEIRTSEGAALMVQREIPGSLPSSTIINLG
jgi:flagellin FlaB